MIFFACLLKQNADADADAILDMWEAYGYFLPTQRADAFDTAIHVVSLDLSGTVC